jgi:hypothetical protein
MNARLRLTLVTAAALALVTSNAMAAVTAEEAAKLNTELTPLGGEKAGNKDGSIPAWTGGYTTPIPGDKPDGRRGDPFKDEKPLFSITAKNVDEYADRLTDGTKALLQKYPEYRIDVYKTHRTAAAPQWVYDNTLKNATHAKLTNEIPEGAYGGIPFPIPKTGAEVIWNHQLRWRGSSWLFQAGLYQLTSEGKPVLVNDIVVDHQMPYYVKDGSVEKFAANPEYWMARLVSVGPPIRVGEAITARRQLNGDKDQAWVYLTGQRRVRKLPNPCCDVPAAPTAGVMNYDEIELFAGRIDRFDWKLVGKKEVYIPYNGNRLLQPKTDAEVIGKHYPNPDYMRWELHRVWVIDATLRAGQRHQEPKGRYYCDEDTWLCVLADRWDANGQLWRVLWSASFVAPDFPGTIGGAFGLNDLISGAAFISNIYTGRPVHYVSKPPYPDSVFTPDAMAAEGAR